MSYAKQAVTRMTMDMGLPDVQKSLSVTVGDTNRRLEVTLIDRGSPFALPPTWTAVLAGVLPSGDELYESCVVDDGRIVFDFVAANAVSSEEGVFAVAFDVFDEGGELVASPKLWVHVTAGARRLKDPLVLERLTALQEFVREINKVNSELSAHTEQIGELMDKITARGTITIPANEWTDTLPRLAYVMVDAYTKGTVMLVMPADNTAQVKAREARVRIQAEYRERQICFYRDGDTDPGALTFNYVLLRTNDPEALPCAALVGVDAYGEGGTNTGGVDQASVEAIVRAIVPEWAREASKPTYTALDVGADPVGTASVLLSAHNVSDAAHHDIRLLIEEHREEVKALLDVDDETLDQLSEIVAYIKTNKTLIDAITTSKVGVADIINDLTTNVANKPLSAAQGVALKALIDGLQSGKLDAVDLTAAKLAQVLGYTPANAANVPTALSQLSGDSTNRTVTDTEKSTWNGKIDKTGISLGIASDGLIYVFVDGVPVGTGIPQGQSGDVFGYVDENNNIVLTGNLADGTYTIKYEAEDEDGNIKTIDIGELVLDSNVYYSVTESLTNCVNSNTAKTVASGDSYTATITANSGYTLSSVTVTMGGSAVSVTGGAINIASVTGNIVITAVAEELPSEPKNLLPDAIFNAEEDPVTSDKGYVSGYKVSNSSGGLSQVSGCYSSGYIPVGLNEIVTIKNITLRSDGSANNVLLFSGTNKASKIIGKPGPTGAFDGGVTVSDGVYTFTPRTWTSDANVAFFRFSCGGITDDTIVTVTKA